MNDILKKRLRERPSRYASETEEQAKERRQQEREKAADRIERLEKIIDVAVTYLHDAGASESAFSVDEMKDRAALEDRT